MAEVRAAGGAICGGQDAGLQLQPALGRNGEPGSKFDFPQEHAQLRNRVFRVAGQRQRVLHAAHVEVSAARLGRRETKAAHLPDEVAPLAG